MATLRSSATVGEPAAILGSGTFILVCVCLFLIWCLTFLDVLERQEEDGDWKAVLWYGEKSAQERTQIYLYNLSALVSSVWKLSSSMNLYVQCPTVYPLELLNKTADNRIFAFQHPLICCTNSTKIFYLLNFICKICGPVEGAGCWASRTAAMRHHPENPRQKMIWRYRRHILIFSHMYEYALSRLYLTFPAINQSYICCPQIFLLPRSIYWRILHYF